MFGVETGVIEISKIRFQIGNSYINILVFEKSGSYYSVRFGRSSRALQVVHTVSGTDTVIWSL